MATQTTNYNLSKPDSTDPFSQFRQSYNDNMDIIDANLGGGGGSGGHTILDPDGNALAQESGLQFTGAVSVTDDNMNGRTVVNVSGGSNLILDAQIYTDTEKVVGVWRDKKPLYQRTFVLSSPITVNGSGTLLPNDIQTALADVEIMVDSECARDSTYSAFISPYVYKSGGQWYILSADNWGNVKFITLRYTKTTDVAGSGGYEAYGFSPVIYSDVERVIGVWRDNKPLYAKTFVQHSTNVSGAGVSFDVSDLDIDTCVDIYGTCDRIVTGVGTLIYPFNAYEDASLRTYVAYSKFNTCINFNIRFYIGESTSTQYITILYTKNSDVAGSGDYNTYGVPTVHYSTSEQVIGTYLGKPLYQKTYSGLSITCTTQGTWYSTGQNYGDIEKIISCDMIDQYGQNIRGSAGYMSITPKPIAINCPVDNRVITDFTISYTKTTD